MCDSDPLCDSETEFFFFSVTFTSSNFIMFSMVIHYVSVFYSYMTTFLMLSERTTSQHFWKMNIFYSIYTLRYFGWCYFILYVQILFLVCFLKGFLYQWCFFLGVYWELASDRKWCHGDRRRKSDTVKTPVYFTEKKMDGDVRSYQLSKYWYSGCIDPY